MAEQENNPFQPVNDPIHPSSQLSSCIEILSFGELMDEGNINVIQVFYERIAQEIYNARKKNYSWGFSVIEPEFINLSDRMVLISKLYEEEELDELNSVIFKLFVEVNNIILATALHMHIPIRGIIRMGETYRGNVVSRKPALMSGQDPLILSDLLKVFSFNEIFPQGFSGRLIPAVEIPYHFGEGLCRSTRELGKLNAVGIFMPIGHLLDKVANVTILSNMIVECDVSGMVYLACNWKEWMSQHSECSSDNILAFAQGEAGNKDNPYSSNWKGLVEYYGRL